MPTNKSTPISELSDFTRRLADLLQRVENYVASHPEAAERFELARLEAIAVLSERGKFTESELSTLS